MASVQVNQYATGCVGVGGGGGGGGSAYLSYTGACGMGMAGGINGMFDVQLGVPVLRKRCAYCRSLQTLPDDGRCVNCGAPL